MTNDKINRAAKIISHEFIYGGHMLSLGAASIALTSAMLLGVKITWDFLLVSYLIFHAIYTYNRYKEFKDDSLTNSARTQHIEKYIKYLPYMIWFLLLIIAIILIFYSNTQAFILGFFIVVGGFLYTDYFKKLTRKIVGFKNFYVAFVWSLIAVFLCIYYNIFFSMELYFFSLFIFLRWLLNTAFFDLKDIESDQKENLKTIPVFFGKERTLIFFHIINILSVFPIIVGVFKGILPLFSLSLLLFYFYGFYYLKKAKDEKTDIQTLSYIMVDGEYLFWPVALFLTKIFF